MLKRTVLDTTAAYAFLLLAILAVFRGWLARSRYHRTLATRQLAALRVQSGETRWGSPLPLLVHNQDCITVICRLVVKIDRDGCWHLKWLIYEYWLLVQSKLTDVWPTTWDANAHSLFTLTINLQITVCSTPWYTVPIVFTVCDDCFPQQTHS